MAGYREFIQEARQRVAGAIEERVGYTMIDRDELELLEAQAMDARSVSKQLDLLGWSTLNYMAGNPHELKSRTRVDWARAARHAWTYDPMAGASVELMNDFVFGRGVPAPRARNPEVQQVIDGVWNDPDNVAVLTGYSAQMALGTDMCLQSNLFVLFFNDGEDGKVKLGLLDHDRVIDCVRDPENRMQPLYYVAMHQESEWDFKTDTLKVTTPVNNAPEVRYYAHWKNVEAALQDVKDGLRKADSVPVPPKEKMGEGLVYHVSWNRTSEMIFGVPSMQRTLRWFSAYNDLMSARVDMAKAASELIMRRKVKGPANSLQRLAQGAINTGGEIAGGIEPTRIGGRPGGTIIENENVTHDAFKLDSGAGNASQDATMLRSQVSAGTRWPQHYLGDQGNANLATATAMELPVTKMVESRQELFEQLFRALADMAIERAVKTGNLKGDLPGEEAEVTDRSKIGEAKSTKGDNSKGKLNDGKKLDGSPDTMGDEAKTDDGKTDLSYEFKMPNALRRLMNDLATTLQTIAKTFDPNGTNIELSRVLLTVALGEALEMQDPAELVKLIYPPGYQDPVIKAELAGQTAPPAGAPTGTAPPESGGTQAAGGEPGSGSEGPYGTPSGAQAPEQTTVEGAAFSIDELAALAVDIAETRFKDLPADVKAESEKRLDGMDSEFADIVGQIADIVAERIPEIPVG